MLDKNSAILLTIMEPTGIKRFTSLCVHTDVTCVEIFDNFLAAGVGDVLNVYKIPEEFKFSETIQSTDKPFKPIIKTPICQGQRIFGVKPNSDISKLIVYGEKVITLLHVDLENVMYKKISQNVLSDWILNAKWIENDSKIATVFMHNKVTVWKEDFTKVDSAKCEERCILYSADICFDKYEQLLVFSGTVFSEVLLWKPYFLNKIGLSPVLKRLKKHKGVIFSIHYNLTNGLICSTSDDRSAVLWQIKNKDLLPTINLDNKDNVKIEAHCQVYGHQSRVFRCLVLNDFFLTAGEDSLLVMWDFNGKCLRKIDGHQGGPVWSICYCPHRDVICSGGNDGAISTNIAKVQASGETISLPAHAAPKIIGILRTGNIICFSNDAAIYVYQQSDKNWIQIDLLLDLKKYCIFQMSNCKRLVALAGFEGQIYIYTENIDSSVSLCYKYSLQNNSRIFSFHWIDCKRFLISLKETMFLCFIFNNKIQVVQKFSLPTLKEPWPTSVCALNEYIVIGDRKGNVHNFKFGDNNVKNTIKKAHNHLGVTNLYKNDFNNRIISLGRDGVIKRYAISNDILECIDYNKTKLSWLTTLDNNYLLSFIGNDFVVSENNNSYRLLFKLHCGGGHRSWDYFRVNQKITVAFVRDKTIYSINLDLRSPKDVLPGLHIREINTLKAIGVGGSHIVVTGGEDTVLGFSKFNENNGEMFVLEKFKVHLSSIRAINIHRMNDNEYLLFTAGGRGQIICWHLCVKHKIFSLHLSCTEKFNFYEPLTDKEGETRIMDLCFQTFDRQRFLFAGCSNGYIKIFLVSDDMHLIFKISILHSHHSITTLLNVNMPYASFLLTMATDGCLKFWSIEDICLKNKTDSLFAFQLHQSGITSCSYTINGNNIYLLTGGDDNATILTWFNLDQCNGDVVITKIDSFCNASNHCAQITGAYLTDKYFLTSSIDQRIVVCKWSQENGQMKFENLQEYFTSIADAQGLEVVDNENNLFVYIYGNGVEYLKITDTD